MNTLLAQTYQLQMSLQSSGSALVDHFVDIPPTPTDDFTDYSGSTFKATITYTSVTYGSLPESAVMTGVNLNSFSPGPTSLQDISVPGATLVALAQNGTTCSAPYGGGVFWGVAPTSISGAPAVGAWFTAAVSTCITSSGTQGNYSYVSEAGDGIMVNLDPTLGSVQYDGPGASHIAFKNYPSSAAQMNYIDYVIAAQLMGQVEGAEQEGFTGYFPSEEEQGYSPLSLVSLTLQRAQAACGDDRDALIAQYAGSWQDPNGNYYAIPLAFVCNDFTQSAHSINYSYQDFMPSNSYDWGLIRYPLVVPPSLNYGLEYLTELIAGTLHPITSGYRGPMDNQRVGGAFKPPPSRHMCGDAVDLQNFTRSKAEHDRIQSLAYMAGAGYVEPLSGPCKYGCVHVDWRNTTGLYAQGQNSP